jgi:phage portal protein BeeE
MLSCNEWSISEIATVFNISQEIFNDVKASGSSKILTAGGTDSSSEVSGQ